MTNIVFIDNYDSFSYNLVEQFKKIDCNIYVYRNDVNMDLLLTKLSELDNLVIVISPGPGNPDSAGIVLDLISTVRSKIPIIGICLGHQSIVQSYGGSVGSSKEIMHGKSSNINIDSKHQIFKGLGEKLLVARYHSLSAITVDKSLDIIAKSDDNTVMAVVNEDDKVCGFQFHPESIMTINGEKLLKNTLDWILS